MHNNGVENSQIKRVVGYNVQNKGSFAAYLCQICSLLLRIPRQLPCGHRVCSSCLDAQEGPSIRCKLCNTDATIDKVNMDHGCRLDMEHLKVICAFCEWTGSLKQYDEHLNQSHFNPFCLYCGREYHSTEALTQHELECESKPIDCALKHHGCQEQYLRAHTHKHFLSDQHQSALVKSIVATLPPPTVQGMAPGPRDSELRETMDMVVDTLHVLSDETQRLNSELLRQQNAFEALSECCAKVSVVTQETRRSVEAQQSNQQVLDCSLASMQQQIDDQKSVSYDGSLLWKIPNVSQKLADAQAERQTSIFSPAFHSSPTGYKMCCRLYLFGDGTARQTHLSLFFVLLRGEYDSVLSFPFHFKVTFVLLDQSGQQRHIIDSFRPDPKSNSFQRPTLSMNIASGIPKFFPISMIQQDGNSYVQDDTMFIRAIIDFDNFPKTMLPFAVSLNPGLPRLVQQEMIRRETERRAQQTTIQPDGNMPTLTE